MQKKNTLFLLLLLMSVNCLAQSVTVDATTIPKDSTVENTFQDAAILWRGFSHEWTYNHRLNRLGNYVNNKNFEQFPHETTAQHTSATGIGADVGVYESHYSYLAANGVHMQSGVTNIKFVGKEGDFHTRHEKMLVDAQPKMSEQEQYVVLISGFDILSETRADKLQLFRLAANGGEYLSATNQVRFSLDAALLVHCRSIECSRFNNNSNYTIQVHYTILSGSTDAFYAIEKNTSAVYNWQKKSEMEYEARSEKVRGVGNNQYETAALAFKSITINLDKDHWMLEWHSVIHPEQYDAKTGIYNYNLNMLFKQWNGEMKKASANPSKSRFAMKRAGWATIDATVWLLQFKDALVVHDSNKDVFKWPGRNLPANSEKSLHTHTLTFDEQILNSNRLELAQKRKAKNDAVSERYEAYVAELELESKVERKAYKQDKKEQKRAGRKAKRAVKKRE